MKKLFFVLPFFLLTQNCLEKASAQTKSFISCEKISESPEMMKCLTKENAVCYVVKTGISCLPLARDIPNLSEIPIQKEYLKTNVF